MNPSRRRFFGRSTRVAPFRPPWSMPEAVFVDACTRCDDCVSACPTGLLKRGDGGFPVADFTAAACTFCGECSDACATSAISRELAAAPWSFSIHIADGCLAHQRVECRVCGELCETKVIRFRPTLGGVSCPEVDHAACTGCGACLAPCPVGAITRVARPSLHPAELS
ncbi:ferredoxin-type protein NapF [Propionivibrio sp.]|uniref:ferredoxin-type protein NapF n=1 Tax=Propionivibrio sp. TaxID=2212460 RepID=UPI00272EC7EE|nr:ferredoxin-type protein NapF [Propionivibrio sp.]